MLLRIVVGNLDRAGSLYLLLIHYRSDDNLLLLNWIHYNFWLLYRWLDNLWLLYRGLDNLWLLYRRLNNFWLLNRRLKDLWLLYRWLDNF